MGDAGLKCCPFCGGTDIGYGDRLSYDDLPEFFVFCRECGTKGPSLEDEESAHGNWNKRAVEDALIQGLETAHGQSCIWAPDSYALEMVRMAIETCLDSLGIVSEKIRKAEVEAALSKARGEVTQ